MSKKQEKKTLLPIYLGLLFVGLVLALAFTLIAPKLSEKIGVFDALCEYNVETNREANIYLDQGVKQNYVCGLQRVRSIDLIFEFAKNTTKGKAQVTVYDLTDQKLVGTCEKDLLYVKHNKKTNFEFESLLEVNPNHQFQLQIAVTGYENKEKSPSVHFAMDAADQENLFWGDNPADGQLIMTIHGYNEGAGHHKVFFFLALLGIEGILFLLAFAVMNKDFVKPRKAEWVIAFGVILACACLFNQGADMFLTIKHAHLLTSCISHGDIGEFYKQSLVSAVESGVITDACNYNIVLYLILAVIMLPISIIQHVGAYTFTDIQEVTYFNIIVSVAVVYVAYELNRLMLDLKLKEETAKTTAYLYLTSLMVLMASVGFSQMDVFYLIFVVWGLRAYVKKKYIRFSLLFSVAIMLKSFPILFFVPMILLVEKRMLHIIKHMVIALGATLLYGVVYSKDLGYQFSKEVLGEIYNFKNRLVSGGFETELGFLSVFILILVITCLWSFDKKIEEKDNWKYMIIFPNIILGAFLVLVGWHPQWMLIATPFIAMACALCREERSFLYCEWGMGVLFWIISFIRFRGVSDVTMVNRGILAEIFDYQSYSFMIADIIKVTDMLNSVIFTAFTGIIIYYCYSMVKQLSKKASVNDCEKRPIEHGVIAARQITAILIILFMMYLYFYKG